MEIQLIDEAKKLFPKLWSVRLSLLAGLISSAEAGVDTYLTGKAPLVAIAAALVAFAAAFARIVAQPALQDPAADKAASE